MSAREYARLADGYELVTEIGGGGMATIYSARDLALGRMVAVKVLRGSLRRDTEAIERLLREARAVASLDHPNILSLFGARLNDDDELCLIMPLVTGGTLRDELERNGRLAPTRVEEVLSQLLSALSHAHTRGIIHRDLKPENVFVRQDDGQVLLADFGIARSAMDEGLTLTSTSLGTPNYMAPEQIDGADLDGRADLYSLGMVAYELLTGERPWQGETLYTVIRKQREEGLPPIQSVRADVPPVLSEVIGKAIAKGRDERWSDARAMQRALRTAEEPLAPPPRTPVAWRESRAADAISASASSPTVRVQSPRAQSKKPRKVRPLLTRGRLGLLGGALLLLLGSLWVWGTGSHEAAATLGLKALEDPSPDLVGFEALEDPSPDLVGFEALEKASPDLVGFEVHEEPSRDFVELKVAEPEAPRAEPKAEAEAGMRDGPSYTPFTVAPEVLNRQAVGEALTREYPTSLLESGVGGVVVMYFFLDEHGVVQEFLVHESSGHDALDRAAMRVAAAFEFSPALNRGEPVPVWILIPITFSST